jgi:HK97 family phage portal protein
MLARLGRPEQRAALPVADPDWDNWIGVRTSAGVQVTPDAAMQVATVLACVSLIAGSLASVPLVLYRKTTNGRREPAEEHPLYPLLHDQANPVQTAFDVRQMLFAAVLLYGNAYAEIEWNAAGYPVALWPLAPDRVRVWQTGNRQLFYTYQNDQGRTDRLPAWRVHHLRGLATAGWVGVSPLRAANAIGLAIATEEFGSRFFGDGAHPSLVLTHPGKLTPEAMKNLRASFEQQWGGLNNAHRVAVVGEGVKPEPMRIPPNESQMLETRGFQVEEICRIFNVAPGLVGAANTQTYASAEQDLIRFRELCLGPWAEAEEKAVARDMLTASERKSYFVQHKLSKLQATDLKTRYESHQIAVLSGLETPNERRQLEDLNPIDGGDLLWMPLNMAPAAAVAANAQQPEPHTEPLAADDKADDKQPAGDDDTPDDTVRALWIADVQQRLANRIANDVRQAGGKALRNGGRVALSEWGENMQIEWRQAGEEMLKIVPDAELATVAAWVPAAYQDAVRNLIHGGTA